MLKRKECKCMEREEKDVRVVIRVKFEGEKQKKTCEEQDRIRSDPLMRSLPVLVWQISCFLVTRLQIHQLFLGF